MKSRQELINRSHEIATMYRDVHIVCADKGARYTAKWILKCAKKTRQVLNIKTYNDALALVRIAKAHVKEYPYPIAGYWERYENSGLKYILFRGFLPMFVDAKPLFGGGQSQAQMLCEPEVTQIPLYTHALC